MKTSKLICMILRNEGTIEASRISFYIKRLMQYGMIEPEGTKIKLTNRGMKYSAIENKEVI